MHGVGSLRKREGRNDDAPNPFGRVEGQEAAMALGDFPHHGRFAGGTESRSAALARLDCDQPIDDVAARHQKCVHLLIQPVDLDAQTGEALAGNGGGRRIKA